MLDEFVEEFLKNFEVIDFCYGSSTNDPTGKNCANNKKNSWQGITFSDVGTGYKTLAGGYFNAYNMNYKVVLLKNGAVIYFGKSHGGPWISVDVNGYKKGPNVIGRDFFVAKSNGVKLLPLGADESYNKNVNGQLCECSKNMGAEDANYFIQVGNPGSGTVVSGGCCSAYYLYSK